MFAFRRFIDVAMISVCLVLSGCFTPALMRATEGTAPGGNINAGTIVGAFKATDNSAAIVCLTMLEPTSGADGLTMLRIPLKESYRWRHRNSRVGIGAITAMRSQAVEQNVANRYINYPAGAADLEHGCPDKGQRLAIVETSAERSGDSQTIDQRKMARLPAGTNEAIVVVRRDDRISNISYVSSAPITEDIHAIDVPLAAASDAKPYLILLAPITVVLDAALVVLYAAAWAYSEPGYQTAPASFTTWKASR